MTGEPALLQARDVSIAVDGSTMVTGLTFETRGTSVLLVGSTKLLLATISGAPMAAGDGLLPEGLARVVSGTLRLLGEDVARGEHRKICGVAPLDPAMPPSWTASEYLRWGARLGGAGRRDARVLAEAALRRLELAELGRRRLHTIAPIYRRALVIALAGLHGPQALVVEAPFEGLEERSRAYMLHVLERAAPGCATLIGTPRLTVGTVVAKLAATASDICLLRDGELMLQADPSAMMGGARHYELTVRAGADALRAELAERGVTLHGGPLHFCVNLPDGLGPSDVLTAAAKARASVVGCVPLIG